MIAWHLGPLHLIEQWLTLLLAFGPFVLLAVVVWWRRRQVVREGAARGGPSDGSVASDPGGEVG